VAELQARGADHGTQLASAEEMLAASTAQMARKDSEHAAAMAIQRAWGERGLRRHARAVRAGCLARVAEGVEQERARSDARARQLEGELEAARHELVQIRQSDLSRTLASSVRGLRELGSELSLVMEERDELQARLDDPKERTAAAQAFAAVEAQCARAKAELSRLQASSLQKDQKIARLRAAQALSKPRVLTKPVGSHSAAPVSTAFGSRSGAPSAGASSKTTGSAAIQSAPSQQPSPPEASSLSSRSAEKARFGEGQLIGQGIPQQRGRLGGWREEEALAAPSPPARSATNTTGTPRLRQPRRSSLSEFKDVERAVQSKPTPKAASKAARATVERAAAAVSVSAARRSQRRSDCAPANGHPPTQCTPHHTAPHSTAQSVGCFRVKAGAVQWQSACPSGGRQRPAFPRYATG
jgi:hypothetical protein